MYLRHIATMIAMLMGASASAAVKTIDETWHDAARERDVPVRIYLDDAPAKPAPVILLSHGLGGSRAAMKYAAEAWAAYGYVCVTLQHPGSDESLWRDVPIGQRMQALKSGMNAKAYLDRCRDVSFAIDELDRRNKADGTLHDRVDVEHVGLAGHSFGAQTVQAIIGQHPPRIGAKISAADPRVKAAIAFSPSYQGDEAKAAFSDVKTPCFHFTGTEDEAPIGGTKPEQRRVPFDAIAAPHQFLVILNGGDHAVFGGTPLRAKPEYDAWQKLIVDLSTKFWDAQLRNDAAASEWLATKGKATVGAAGTFEMK